MRKLAKVAVLALALPLAGCASEPERPPATPVKNVVFRLTQQASSVEVRLEADYFPNHNYELVVVEKGTAGPAGVILEIEGSIAPVEPRGSAAPAFATVLVPVDPNQSGPWNLRLRLRGSDGTEQEDLYALEYRSGRWRVSREQGLFSRFEPNGSY